MLILLPPSEGKAIAAEGPPLDLEALSFPQLTRTRARVLDRLVRVSGQRNALTLLGVAGGLAPQVARNTRLRELPAAPAERIYTGVLYEALGLSALSEEARRRAESSVLIFSALFGVLRPTDRVPAYRLAMDADLPRMGPLARLWRGVLDPVIRGAAGDGAIVDCRSAPYAAAWRPSPPVAARVLAVRVLQEAAGRRTVVSHMAKRTRGEVARALLEAPSVPDTPDDIVAELRRWFDVEVAAPVRPGDTWTLDVIVPIG